MARMKHELAVAKHQEARLESELRRSGRNIAAQEQEVQHLRWILAAQTPVTAVSNLSYSTSTGSTSIFWFQFYCRL